MKTKDSKKNRHPSFMGWTQHKMKVVRKKDSSSKLPRVIKKKIRKNISKISMSLFFLIFLLLLIFGSILPNMGK